MSNDLTGLESDYKEIDTWINEAHICAVEDIKPFGEEYAKGRDYVIYLTCGLSLNCIGDLNDITKALPFSMLN